MDIGRATPLYCVAPHVGAWIEIEMGRWKGSQGEVAPHVGAWIEIFKYNDKTVTMRSHPTWVRGLKYKCLHPPSHGLRKQP